MEEGIDLRPYIRLVWQRRLWIVGTAVLAALLAFLLSQFVSDKFTATAIVVNTQPRQVVQFDPRFENTSDDTKPFGAYPELATSDQLLEELLVAIRPSLEEIETLNDLKKLLTATQGGDINVINLSVEYSNPSEAAQIANTWAELFVTWTRELYGIQNEEPVRFFENQLAEAELALSITEQALVDFQANNRSSIFSNELDILKQAQAKQLDKQQRLFDLIQNTQNLYTQLQSYQGERAISPGEQLAILSLQLQAFNTDFPLSLELQLSDNELLTATTSEDELAALNTLLATLEVASSQTEAWLADVEPQILALQKLVQEASTQANRLSWKRDLAQETYQSLARKVEEEQITSQDTSSGFQFASRASIPTIPSSFGSLIWAALAGTLGAMLSSLSVLLFEWWRQANAKNS